jgi:hypothetical protein
MRPLRILAVAVTLAVANCLPGALRAQEQQPSSESMAAAQALFALLFTHGFATLNAQAVEAAWPGIESALRTQRRISTQQRSPTCAGNSSASASRGCPRS